MKMRFNKKSIIITSAALLLLVAVGTTLAYVFTGSGAVINTFTPSRVACAVVENGKTGADDAVTGSLVYTGDKKENVQIMNTGDTEAYIRVAVVVNWMSKDGTKVWAQKPVASTLDGTGNVVTEGDYTIKYNLTNTGWFEAGDGFYYYSKPVAPGALTVDALISEATVHNPGPKGTDNTQYYLSIEIVASAIQSTPTNVVIDNWGVTVNDDGTISKQGG